MAIGPQSRKLPWVDTIQESQRDSIVHPGVPNAFEATPGKHHPTKIINPERVESIPHIPFVEFDFVTPQQFPELILK